MSDQSHKNNINFRLNDENLKKLELMAESDELSKSTLTRKIIETKLNDPLNDSLQDIVPYPQPIIKKIFDLLNTSQKNNLISEINEYYNPLIESIKFQQTPHEIVVLMTRWLKNSGCSVNITNFKLRDIMGVHHYLGKNWSEITCTTVAYALQNLDYKIVRTFNEETWFKIEYSEV